jgi:Flp pilus assembly protein TadD
LQAAAHLPGSAPEVHFQLAAVLRSLGDASMAENQTKLYQQELAERAQHDQLVSLSAQASQKLEAGDAAGAADVERMILEKFPNEAVHWYDLSLALDRLSDFPGETAALEHAVTLRPDFALAWNELGYLKAQASQNGEAEADLRRAVSLAPQFAEAQNNLGSLLVQEGKVDEAEQYFRLALESNPRYVDAWINLAASLAERSRFPGARLAIESALRLQPQNESAIQLLHMLPSGPDEEAHP